MTPRKKAKELLKTVSYHYFKDMNSEGRVVVAIAKDDSYYYYGISYCAPNDNFTKVIGRGKALSRVLNVTRWNTHEIFFNSVNTSYAGYNTESKYMNRHDFAKHIMNHLAVKPKWAIKSIFIPKLSKKIKEACAQM